MDRPSAGEGQAFEVDLFETNGHIGLTVVPQSGGEFYAVHFSLEDAKQLASGLNDAIFRVAGTRDT